MPNVKHLFNTASHKLTLDSSERLTLIIRKDANHATSTLYGNIVNHMRGIPDALFNAASSFSSLDKHVEKVVHDAYGAWGDDVLNAMVHSLDYDHYKVEEASDRMFDVHFYNANNLAEATVEKGRALVRQVDPGSGNIPTVFITLDDMIQEKDEFWGGIGFSRLFSICGGQQHGYVGRPGKDTIENQIKTVGALVKKLNQQYGREIPVVLLEDNVRHAKTLNWIVDLIDQHGMLEGGKLIGIASCFCCASPAELAKIQHKGVVLPVVAVADYPNMKVDVATTRDLLFDGYVVEVGGKHTRLPAIFMDIEKVFKINLSKKIEFLQQVRDANIAFCRRVEQTLDIKLPLACFSGADAIAHVTGLPLTTPMTDVLHALPGLAFSPVRSKPENDAPAPVLY